MKIKKSFAKGYLFGALTVFILVGIGFGVNFVVKDFKASVLEDYGIGEKTEFNSYEDKFDELERMIDEYYYKDYDEEEMMDSAIKGYIKGIGDPYSAYFNKEDLVEFMEDNEGEYEGIGVVVGYTEEGNLVEVISPYVGSPGEKAGLLPGDVIIAVDSVDVTELDLEDVVSLIRGERGTTVVLTVFRDTEHQRETLDVDIVRDSIEVHTVNHEMLDNKIGYIQLTGFKEVTYGQFMDALTDLEAQEEEGLIIDLRNNPGGYLHIVNKIADELLPEGLIVYTQDKNGNREEYKTDEEKQFNKPLVVLVNGNSASASEILSGAVKDYGIGTIVGKTTFGKGIVQNTRFLQDGTALKLTVEKYYTPNGNYIHDVGVEPDVVVELPDTVISPFRVEREDDTQLDKAIEIVAEEINE